VHVHHADGEAKFSSYEGSVDDAALPRARFLAACRGVDDVAFGLDTDRREYVESGLRHLHFAWLVKRISETQHQRAGIWD
jgi:hypothetical protein